jgi:hypothetical protein
VAGSIDQALDNFLAGKPSGGTAAAVTPADARPDPVDAALDRFLDVRPQAQDALKATAGVNPDEVAKRRALARETGLEEAVVAADVESAEGLAQEQRYSDALTDAPLTAAWLADPYNAEIARDSVQQLSTLEAVGNAFRRGFLQQEQGRAESRFSMERNPELAARLEAEINGLGKNGTGVVSFFEEAATVIGQQASTFVNPATVGMVAGGAALGSVVPGVGTAVGATAGLVASVFRDTVLSTSASAYKTMLEANVPEDRALAFSGVAGGVVGALDIVGFTRFLKMFGIGEDAAQKAAAKGVTEVVKRVGKEYATVVGVEVGTEIAQEVVQIAAEELAKATSEGAAAPATAAEVLERIEEVAIATAKAMVVLGAPGGAATYKRERKAQQAAEDAGKKADEVQKEIVGTPLNDRSPEDNIKVAAQVAPIEARVDIEKLVELAQTRGVSPDELFAELGVEEQAAIATLAEGEVTLPPEAVARLMASENWNDVKDNLRYGENEFSVEDAKLSREEAAAAAEELTAPPKEEAAAEPPVPEGSVRLYHGGSPSNDPNMPLWVTRSKADAEGWAARGEGMGVFYVDVPADDPAVKAFEGDLPNGIAPVSRFELPPELARSRKRLGEAVAAPAEPQFDMAAAQEQLRAAGFPEAEIAALSPEDIMALTDPVDPGNPRTARVGTQPVEAEVGLAEEEMGYQALFRTASDAGMSRSVYQSYLAAIARVKEAARQRQERKHLRAEEAKLSDEWNAAREEVLAEVREAVNNEPVYQALGSLGALRLDRNAVIDLYLDFNAEFVTGRESMNLATRRKEIEEGVLPAMNKHSDTPASPPIAIFSAKGKDGINPNLLAERFGFESGRAMVDAMASAKARETEIFARTEAEMARRYPELQENLRGVKAAIESLHETDWVNVIAAELNQLRAATDQKRTKPKLLRAEARKNFGNINANDARLTSRFENQERKRRREAGRLVRKNDRKGAAKAKLLELFNHEYFKEAIRFRNEQSADKKLIRRIMAKGAKFEGRDADYVDAAKLLLARYDGLAPENRAENAREEAAEAILAAFNDALPPPKSVDRLTVNEWRAIMQATRAIYQQALDGGKLKAQGKNATLERAVAEMVASAEVLPDVPAEGSTPDGKRTEPGIFSRAGFAVMNALNTFRQVGFIFERLDRGDKAGPWSKYLYRTMESAYAAKQKIDKNLLLPIVDKLARFTGDANMLKKTKVDGGIGVELTNIDRFMLALNFGNTSNIDKVLDERGMKADPRFKYGNWTYETVRAEIASLPPGLTDLVQETWDAFASIYPEVEQTYRDRYGTSPTRIEPQSLNLGDGRVLRGGYFPMMYDRSRMVQVRQEGMDTTATKDGKFDNEAFFQSVVYSGMTKNRTSFSAPVDLDAGRMALAFGQVSHYVTHYNAVRDARKIINSQGVAQTIVAKEGNQVLELLNKWIDDIAAQGSRDTDTGFLTKAAEYIRRSTTAAFLSLSLRTLFMQPLGVANSIYLLGRKEKGGFSSWQGIKSLVKDGYGTLMSMSPTQRRRALDQMYSLSNLMSDRINSIDVAVGEAVDRARGTGSVKDRIASTGLRAISRVQFATVDVPTWFGAFNKAVSEGKSEGDAAAIADKIVSQAQGDGRQFALSEAQRSRNPLWRVSTPFLTFVFAQHNQLRQIMEDARDNRGAGSKRSMASKMFWAVGVGAVLEAAMAGDTPEEDDDVLLWAARRFAAQSITAAVPVFGDTAATYLKYGQAFGGKNVAVQMIDGVGKAIGETYKVATDEKDFDEATLKALIKGFGVAAGVPGTSQAVRLVDAFAGEEEDFIRTLMMGKPPGK